MITLYHAPPSRSLVAQRMLEELELPYEMHLIDLNKGEQKSPSYLKINPMGKVPAIDHDGVIVTENAAICCYLADAFPEKQMTVPIGDRRRGPYLKWLFFGPGCVEPAFIDRALKRDQGPDRMLGYGTLEHTMGVIEDAVRDQPFLMGEQFTAADVVISMGVGYAVMTKVFEPPPVLAAYLERCGSRPAQARVNEKNAPLMQPRG